MNNPNACKSPSAPTTACGPRVLSEDSRRCIEARNRLNAALHGEGAIIDGLEMAVASACQRLASFDAFIARQKAAPAQETACQQALEQLVAVIEAAGLENLVRGVQLGPTVWYVKASDALDQARAALRASGPRSPGED